MRLIIVLFGAAALAFAAERNDYNERKKQVQRSIDQKDYSGALAEAKRINKEWPDDVGTYQLIASAALGYGDYAEAESAIQWMLDLRIGKADPEGWLLVSLFREVTGDVEGALEAIRAAFGTLRQDQLDQRDRLIAHSAHLYILQGRNDLADRALQCVSERVAGNPVLLKALGELRLVQGRRQDASGLFRQLAGIAPSPSHLYLLAVATGKTEDYASFVRTAKQRSTLADNANVELVFYLAGQGDKPGEALEIARTEYARRHDVRTAAALSLALFRTGDKAEARRFMTGVLATGTHDPEIRRIAEETGLPKND